MMGQNIKLNFKYSILISIGLFSCASSQKFSNEPMSKTNIIERADGAENTPEWASFSKPSYEANGNSYFLGNVEVDGESLKSAALNMSDEKAFSEPMRALISEFLDQNQVAEDLNQSVGQRIISATHGFRPPMPGLKIVKRYWELVETKYADNSGSTKYKLRCFSLAEIPSAELEKAKRKYFETLESKSELKNILKEVGEQQRNKVLSAESEH